MKNSHKAIIVVIVVIFALIISLGTLAMIGAGKERHHQMCTTWSNQLDTHKAQMESNVFRGDAEVAQFNAEVADYNRQCAF